MRFDPSPGTRSAQLAAFVAYLDTGPGNASVEIFQGPDPAVPGGPPTGSVLLVACPLPKPMGTVTAGVLTLAVSPLALIANSGSATWARWYTSTGAWAGDCDVSLDTGTGLIRLADTTLFAGGKTQILGGTLV